MITWRSRRCSTSTACADFTGGENGIQGVPRGALLSNMRVMYYFVAAVFLAGFGIIHRGVHLALRTGAQGDPRERAARHLARVQDRPVQAARLRALRRALRAGRRDQVIVFQLASLTDVHWGT